VSDVRPTPEQEAAISTRDRDVLLAAGAGTGKTRVLAERYVGAVLDLAREGAENPADAILAFTFTDRDLAGTRRWRRRGGGAVAATRRRGPQSRLDLDHPRLLPAPAAHPPDEARARPALPGARGRGG
jgi:ATP-dependent helicase/nuclease subunit A